MSTFQTLVKKMIFNEGAGNALFLERTKIKYTQSVGAWIFKVVPTAQAVHVLKKLNTFDYKRTNLFGNEQRGAVDSIERCLKRLPLK